MVARKRRCGRCKKATTPSHTRSACEAWHSARGLESPPTDPGTHTDEEVDVESEPTASAPATAGVATSPTSNLGDGVGDPDHRPKESSAPYLTCICGIDWPKCGKATLRNLLTFPPPSGVATADSSTTLTMLELEAQQKSMIKSNKANERKRTIEKKYAMAKDGSKRLKYADSIHNWKQLGKMGAHVESIIGELDEEIAESEDGGVSPDAAIQLRKLLHEGLLTRLIAPAMREREFSDRSEGGDIVGRLSQERSDSNGRGVIENWVDKKDGKQISAERLLQSTHDYLKQGGGWATAVAQTTARRAALRASGGGSGSGNGIGGGGRGDHQNKKKQTPCYNCNKRGHKANSCKAPGGGAYAGKPTPKPGAGAK